MPGIVLGSGHTMVNKIQGGLIVYRESKAETQLTQYNVLNVKILSSNQLVLTVLTIASQLANVHLSISSLVIYLQF